MAARSVGGAIPGRNIALVPVATYTDPAIGHLVTWDTTANNNVDRCANNENPIGMVVGVNPGKTVVTVELFSGGMVAVLPYSSAPSRGDKIECTGNLKSGTTESLVVADNANGVGRVIAVDRKSGYCDVYFG